MTQQVINNHLVETVRAGHPAPIRLLLGFGIRPSMDLDQVHVKVNDLGVEVSEVDRKSLWQWAHQAPLADGVMVLAEVVLREQARLSDNQQLDGWNRLWKEACQGALEVGHLPALQYTWDLMRQHASGHAGREAQRLAVFYECAHRLPHHAGRMCALLLGDGYLPASEAVASSRTPAADKLLERIALHAPVEDIQALRQAGVQGWSCGGQPWVGMIWQERLDMHEDTPRALQRLAHIMEDPDAWVELARAPRGAALIGAWQDSLDGLRQEWGDTSWMHSWTSVVEREILAVTLDDSLAPPSPRRARSRI